MQETWPCLDLSYSMANFCKITYSILPLVLSEMNCIPLFTSDKTLHVCQKCYYNLFIFTNKCLGIIHLDNRICKMII